MTIIDKLLEGKVFAHCCESNFYPMRVEIIMHLMPSITGTKRYVEYISIEMRLTNHENVRRKTLRMLFNRDQYESSIKKFYVQNLFYRMSVCLTEEVEKDWNVLINACIDNLTEVQSPNPQELTIMKLTKE